LELVHSAEFWSLMSYAAQVTVFETAGTVSDGMSILR
jgi:hypothetical protein